MLHMMVYLMGKEPTSFFESSLDNLSTSTRLHSSKETKSPLSL